MTSMKRVGLAVLLAVGLALVTTSPARAQTWGGTITLVNTAHDKDQGATGTATLSDVGYAWPVLDGYVIGFGHLTVRCEGLTPGATYAVGPTYVELYPNPLHYKKNRGLPGYSSVTASNDSTLELDIDVSFIGGWCYWYDPAAGTLLEGWGWWEFGGYVDYYGIEVLRKNGAKYIQVLAGGWSASGD